MILKYAFSSSEAKQKEINLLKGFYSSLNKRLQQLKRGRLKAKKVFHVEVQKKKKGIARNFKGQQEEKDQGKEKRRKKVFFKAKRSE